MLFALAPVVSFISQAVTLIGPTIAALNEVAPFIAGARAALEAILQHSPEAADSEDFQQVNTALAELEARFQQHVATRLAADENKLN